MTQRTPQEAIKAACDMLGSQRALAASLGVSPPTVNEWVLGTKPVPAAQAPHIEYLTSGAVPCEETCPKVPWHFVRGVPPVAMAEPEDARDLRRLRDEFAGQALQSGAASNWRDNDYKPVDGMSIIDNTARHAYQIADAMMKARSA